MRTIINIFVILAIGLGVGSVTANYSLDRTYSLGAINTGPWSAWPFAGGSEVDPYTNARFTADGTIPLGAAEGLTFEAITDSGGTPLRANCNYRVTGNTSATRLWTIAAYNDNGKLVREDVEGLSAAFSGRIIRFPDSTFNIKLSKSPRSGNWMGLEGNGNFKLILRLYDTPITSNSGVIEPTMPDIVLEECA